jgi:hypothetical protein
MKDTGPEGTSTFGAAIRATVATLMSAVYQGSPLWSTHPVGA